MNTPTLSSETIHASSVAVAGRAVLIAGRSGSGKSDLALRLVDRGATLISDDYTMVRRSGGLLVASAPPNIKGKLEVRGVGVLEFQTVADVPVSLYVDLDDDIQRLPEMLQPRRIAGIEVPMIALRALESSAPVKVEVALATFGLEPE
jgi:serine kinase of HPr protein (carbohydrate metabolism regulator)